MSTSLMHLSPDPYECRQHGCDDAMSTSLLLSLSHRTSYEALKRAHTAGIQVRQEPPSAAEMEAMRRERTLQRVAFGGGGMCHEVAPRIEREFGWPAVVGSYLTEAGEVICGGGHVWNVLADGSILDATADQWCEGDDIRIIHPDDDAYLRYRVGFSPDGIHPGDGVTPWPELAGQSWDGRADVEVADGNFEARGDGWWTEDGAARTHWCALNAIAAAIRAFSRIPYDTAPASGPLNGIAESCRSLWQLNTALPETSAFGRSEGAVMRRLLEQGAVTVETVLDTWEGDKPPRTISQKPKDLLAVRVVERYAFWKSFVHRYREPEVAASRTP